MLICTEGDVHRPSKVLFHKFNDTLESIFPILYSDSSQ